MYVHVHKIVEDSFGGCKKSFSWLGQKVNKKINAYGHDADDSGMLRPSKTSTPFSILTEFLTSSGLVLTLCKSYIQWTGPYTV